MLNWLLVIFFFLFLSRRRRKTIWTKGRSILERLRPGRRNGSASRWGRSLWCQRTMRRRLRYGLKCSQSLLWFRECIVAWSCAHSESSDRLQMTTVIASVDHIVTLITRRPYQAIGTQWYSRNIQSNGRYVLFENVLRGVGVSLAFIGKLQ